MNKNEFIGGIFIWAATVLFCQCAFGATGSQQLMPAPAIDSSAPRVVTFTQPVTHRYKLVPVTLEDGTPGMAIKPKNFAERTVDKIRATGKAHPKICWTARTTVNTGLKACQVYAALRH